MSAKRLLSRVANAAGVTRALEAFRRRPAVIVINYHRVGEAERCRFDRNVIEATPSEFDEQLALIKKRYVFTDLEEVQAFAEGRARLSRCHVLITFDDGYRDAYDVALPILKAHGVRATFFIPTSFVGTARVPWWDQLAFVVRATNKRLIHLMYPREQALDLVRLGREPAIRSLLRTYKDPGTADPNRFLTELAASCEVAPPEESADRLFLSWDEARVLVREGMSIGSHTHTHRVLSKLTEGEQLEECIKSREILRAKLGIAAESMAFPVGSRASFSNTTAKCTRDAGYRTAFSYYGGVNTPGMNPLNLLRMSAAESSGEHRFRTAVAAATALQIW